MTTRTAAVNKQLLARARERRLKLDEDEDAQKERQDVATAVALVALEKLAEVEAARELATAEVGEAVRALMAENVAAERAASLLAVDVVEVRRLSKVTPIEAPAAPAAKTSSKAVASSSTGGAAAVGKATLTALPEGVSEDAARRAG